MAYIRGPEYRPRQCSLCLLDLFCTRKLVLNRDARVQGSLVTMGVELGRDLVQTGNICSFTDCFPSSWVLYRSNSGLNKFNLLIRAGLVGAINFVIAIDI